MKQTAPAIIVVGGGPAGIMAAGRAAEAGARVVLVEKTGRLGAKLLITGGGRCNVTNTAAPRDFIHAYGKNGKFLYSALTAFSNEDLREFLAERACPTRSDPDGKVFPADDRAHSILAALTAWMERSGVRVLFNTAAAGVIISSGSARGIRTVDGAELAADALILAAGGMSYPATGSNGDGHAIARGCGHRVSALLPGLSALESDDVFIRDIQGLTLRDAALTLLIDGRPAARQRGDLLFTHFGVSGPAALALSGAVSEALGAGRAVAFSVNLRPEYTPQELDQLVRDELEGSGSRTAVRYANATLPASLAPVVVKLAGIDPHKKCSIVSREERLRLTGVMADLRFGITRPRPIAEAMVTRGGVVLDEIDPRTMQSRLVHGLYLCGEMIDIDGASGGFNLQAAFSTGHLAGLSAAGRGRGH